MDDLHSWDNQENQMEGESGVTPRIIDELHSGNFQGYQMEGETNVT